MVEAVSECRTRSGLGGLTASWTNLRPESRRHHIARVILVPLALLIAAIPARAEWQAREVEKTYAITGTTGGALYESIGNNGPRIRGGVSSAIAYTTFKLLWNRDYRRDGNSCVLAAAKPFLTITYTLPKPAGKLPPRLAARWRAFIEGIRAHEKVHGKMIRELTRNLLDVTVGFRQDNDPGCKTIRKTIMAPIRAAYDRHKARNRAFEKAEMAQGGPIHKLIIGLLK